MGHLDGCQERGRELEGPTTLRQYNLLSGPFKEQTCLGSRATDDHVRTIVILILRTFQGLRVTKPAGVIQVATCHSGNVCVLLEG